jgi:hypothetical protein
MKRLILSTIAFMFVIGSLVSTPTAHAQGAASLTATVDRNQLQLGESLVLTLTLNTPGLSSPQLSLPQMDQFRVNGNSQSLQTNIINGAMSTTLINTFELQPVSLGDLTIPGFSLDWNGQQLSTEPIRILVTQGANTPNDASVPASQNQNPAALPDDKVHRKGTHDLFIETSTDKTSIYTGEAVQFTTRLFNSTMSFGQPDYQPPQFIGFWHPQKPEIRQYYATGSDGTPYDVTEITTWLFPTTPGRATIDAATITTPGGFFTDGAQVQSDPISLEVKPLPAGAPAGFSGAVGQFTLKSTPDRLSTRLGEPVTLQVELSGSGNWGTLGDPQWPEDKNWRVYQKANHSQSSISSGQMTGSRTFEQLWTPLAQGKVALPAIQYTYFDPAAAQYQTITSPAQTITVDPGDPRLAALPQNTASGNALAAPKPEYPEQIKQTPVVFTTAAKPLAHQVGFLLLFLVPLGLVLGDLTLAYRKYYLNTHASDLRRSRAYRRARRQLKRLPRRADNVQSEVARIMLIYLEDHIQQPLTGLPHSVLAQVMQANMVSPDLAQQVIDTLFAGESSEYTHQLPASYDQVVGSALRLLDELEKVRS